LSAVSPLASIPVGVIVERSKSTSPWVDFLWRPLAVLPGQPETEPWTKLSDDGERASFYAGNADVQLYRTETANYRDNLHLPTPLLWVVLRPAESEPPYALLTVTADPAEGEALTEPGTDLVDSVPMPESIRETIAAFIAEHPVEQVSIKRKRDRADPEALARRGPSRGDGE
jgi:hypothetical protein